MVIVVGALVVLLGLVLLLTDKIPFLGKLPGDLSIKRENLEFIFPMTTSIVLSLLLSMILSIFSHFKER